MHGQFFVIQTQGGKQRCVVPKSGQPKTDFGFGKHELFYVIYIAQRFRDEWYLRDTLFKIFISQ